MDTKKIKKLLAGVGISTILSAGGIAGCTPAGHSSCSSCGAKKDSSMEKSRTSCSAGGSSCTGQPSDQVKDTPENKLTTPDSGGSGCGGVGGQ